MTTREEQALPELDGYEVLAAIAKGGMAEVFLARPRARAPESTQLVALKIMRPELCRNAEFVSMFLDEARIASRLAHPNIAAVHASGNDRGQYFLAMDLLRGRTLLDVVDEALRRNSRLPFEVVAWIGARIADALHYAHDLKDESGASQQLVHRDVNPSNVFVTYRGEPKLIDFGLAKARDRITSTAHGVLKGKLAYLAPEQIAGATLDRRVDVFALGVTLWEVSVGDRLFRADDDVETVRRVSRAEVPDPTTRVPGYPRALADVILKSLARSPNDRYRTAHDFAVALDTVAKSGKRPIDAAQVGALIRVLFPESAARPWEKLSDELAPESTQHEALADGKIVRAWDEANQKSTWMAVSVDEIEVTEADEPEAEDKDTMRLNGRTPLRDLLDGAIAERLASLGSRDDTVRARTLLERAAVDEAFGDTESADKNVEVSLQARPTAAGYAALRRHRRGRSTPRALVELLDAELAVTSDQRTRADLLAERGRLLRAADDLGAARASFVRALELVPNHPGALKGLEGALRRSKKAEQDLAAHLGRVADAYVDEPLLAAWVHVERAQILDADLEMRDEARGALARALELDPSLGPVRRACLAHAAIHRDAPWLVVLLTDEAEREQDGDRAAALELEAATIARHLLADTKRAVGILERARKRKIVSTMLRRAVLDELVILHERAGRADAALSVRRERIGLVRDVGERAVELRAIARLEEASGDIDRAIASVEEARRHAPSDTTLAFELDRLLERAAKVERRIALFAHEAATSMDSEHRATCALRAAQIAEGAGLRERALELHRLALSIAPGSIEAIDAIDRLTRPTLSASSAEEARARVALHRHAAEHASDVDRRIAHLEIVALVSEEMLGDVDAALSAFRTILSLAPARRSALIGVARAAQRKGDLGEVARALLLESELVPAGSERDALRVRAASALIGDNNVKARTLLEEALARDPSNGLARVVKIRLHERAEEWQFVAREHTQALASVSDDADKIARLLTRAEIERSRLGSRRDALATAKEALQVDPKDARAIALALTLLDELDDPKAARDGLLAFRESADADVKARATLRAATIAEHVLGDDTGAMDLFDRLAEEHPNESWLRERNVRIARRRAQRGESEPLVRMLEATANTGDELAAFELAVFHAKHAPERAAALTERIAGAFPSAPHALRWMELVGITSDKPTVIANALAAQVAAFNSKAARLGALWEEIGLVDWTLNGDVRTELELVLSMAPDDRAALDGVIVKSAAALRAGDEAARGPLALALRDLATSSSDELLKLTAQIGLAVVLHQAARTKPGEREALREYRTALRLEPHSVVAATGAARLGAQAGDTRAAVDGLLALSDIAKAPERRATLLTQAAGALVAAGEGNLGPRSERLSRAAELLERALAADPEAVLAITMLVAVRSEDGAHERLLSTLGAVLDRAKSKEAIVTAGIELARVAQADPERRVTAIDALRRVLAIAPHETAAHRAMAEVYMAQGARADAARALEAVAANAREPREKIDALFGLAEIYREANAQEDVERVLRVVLDVDPLSTRALSELAGFRRNSGAPKADIAGLLARLADAAPAGEEKAKALLELAELKREANDVEGAERDFVEGTAHAPTAARLARLLELSPDPAEQARVLSLVVARGEQLKRPYAAAWSALGQLEIDSLRRAADGVAHVRRALALEPSMPEARAALARGLLATGKNDEVVQVVMGMMLPDATPLLSLRDAGGALATLELALLKQGRRDESIVVRELRAVSGALDDGAHVELRARRRGPVLAPGEGERIMPTLVPDEGRAALTVAHALAGIDAKMARTDLDALGISPRQRLTSSNPIVATVVWLARLFGVDAPNVAMSDRLNAPRTLSIDGDVWIGVPAALGSRPEPEQIALLTRPIVRAALATTWLDELLPDEVLALLVATVKRAAPDSNAADAQVDPSLVDDFAQRITRAASRKQKKALVDLAPRVQELSPFTADDVEKLIRAVARAELRAAFVVTGDLLATLDAARAGQPALRRDTESAGPRALAAYFAHAHTSDLLQTALSPRTTAVRGRLGTLWTGGATPQQQRSI